MPSTAYIKPMPYTWTHANSETQLTAWPYRSLPKRGFVLMISVTSAFIALPLLAVLGSPILWGLLPFLALAIAALWWGLQRSYRDAEILEELTITDHQIHLRRHNPRGPVQEWDSNCHWARVHLHAQGGPVEHYLTLKGDNPREVEIGRFLTAQERQALYGELQGAIAAANAP